MRSLTINELRGKNYPGNALKTLEVSQLRLGLRIIDIVGSYRGEGVQIYSADTAKTGHLPIKKIPEPGWFGHAGLSLVGGEILDEGQQELGP